jgi:probable HAF family extracellular repeat protein
MTIRPAESEAAMFKRHPVSAFPVACTFIALAACSRTAAPPTIPALLANGKALQVKAAVRYSVVDLGTLGGALSEAGMYDGLVIGFAMRSDGSVHAFVWSNGKMRDLGTLGGANSFAVGGAPAINAIAGASETNKPDPNGEDYCTLGTHATCRAFVWQNGSMRPLPALGGNNSGASAINAAGQVVGAAETTFRDPTCRKPEIFGYKPVIWHHGRIEKVLPTWPGDSAGVASFINDHGLVVGYSGACARGFATSIRHALVWRDGKAINLGNWGWANEVNDLGQVTGFAGNRRYPHAFLWQNGKTQDLGILPGDVSSESEGVSPDGKLIVGGSCHGPGDTVNCRAVIWQAGVMTDLNTLIPANTGLYLLNAVGNPNAQGQIAGNALVKATKQIHGFLATPLK